MRSSWVLASFGSLSFAWFACVGDNPSSIVDPDAPGPDAASSGNGSSGNLDAAPDDAGKQADRDASAPRLDGVLLVTAGDAHTCALDTAGAVYCWGGNGNGQLGKSPVEVTRSSLPLRVDLGGIVKSLAAGAAHTCAVLADDVVKCWGKNEQGQCGRTPFAAYVLPYAVLPAEDSSDPSFRALKVVAGGNDTCALANAEATAVLDDARTLYCWGDNQYGQTGTTASQFPQPGPNLIPYNRNNPSSIDLAVNGAAVGGTFTCARTYAVLPNSSVIKDVMVCAGSNFADTRIADAGASPDLALLADAPGDFYASVGVFALGETHGCLRFPDTTAANAPAFGCFGGNDFGQGGTSTSTRRVRPIDGVEATAVTDVAARGKVTCVIESNAVRCFGDNRAGQLGRGTVDSASHPDVVSVVDLAPQASHVAVGGSHTCVVLGGGSGQAGQVACWGSNASGQLGDGADPSVGYPDAPAAERTLRSRPVYVRAR